MKELQKRWLKAIIISLIIFILLLIYLYIRRGSFNIYDANKAFGSIAVILAGITLIMGPLSRSGVRPIAKYMTIRRQLGVSAFIYGVLHVIASLTLQERFPFPQWYGEEWLPVIMGLIAIVTWGYLAFISRDSKIQKMGGIKWIKHLSSGAQIAFIAVFLHLVIMKYEGWIRFLSGQPQQQGNVANPVYPQSSLFIFLFMVAVIVFRIFTKIKGR
jgi:DMSO/TMAO reductase YedYZ heme-binding membrane subunit